MSCPRTMVRLGVALFIASCAKPVALPLQPQQLRPAVRATGVEDGLTVTCDLFFSEDGQIFVSIAATNTSDAAQLVYQNRWPVTGWWEGGTLIEAGIGRSSVGVNYHMASWDTEYMAVAPGETLTYRPATLRFHADGDSLLYNHTDIGTHRAVRFRCGVQRFESESSIPTWLWTETISLHMYDKETSIEPSDPGMSYPDVWRVEDEERRY